MLKKFASRKRVFVIGILICLFFSANIIPSQAAEQSILRWSYFSGVTTSLSINTSGVASANGNSDTADPSIINEGTLNLQKKVNGVWTTIGTWSGSGIGDCFVSGSKSVESGFEYRTKFRAVAVDGGITVETVYVYSTVRTY